MTEHGRSSHNSAPLLSIRDLVVEFGTGAGRVRAVDGLDLDVQPGETVGVVGESGAGKTLTVLAVLGLLPRAARVVSGSIQFEGRNLLKLSSRRLRELRGKDVGMIFQDPLTALHPAYRVLDQVAEAVRAHHRGLSGRKAEQRAAQLLEQVGVPDASKRRQQYPHQWSGGMRQRAVIASAIANRPRLLIADEPTTALDVTIQTQILDVLRAAKDDLGAATVLITHDLGVVAEMADRVVVMYGGRVLESGPVKRIFHAPRHHYTAGLLATLPHIDGPIRPLTPIPGQPLRPGERIAGCPFRPRCTVGRGEDRCGAHRPVLSAIGTSAHLVACHYPLGTDSQDPSAEGRSCSC